jgi:hypothetical protein
MTLSEELTWRGLVNQTTFKDIKDLDKEKRVFYFGVDANSAPSATVGNLAAMMMVKRFIKHGNTPILLVGGATGRIGDPKDDEERPEVTDDVVESNKKGIVSQYKDVFDGLDFLVVDNNDWFKSINYINFLKEVGKRISMSQLLDRDFVKSRVGDGKSGLSYAEFSYSLIQGYDFLHLFRNHNTTLQICGSDQWGNSIQGVDLIRKCEGEIAHVWSCPLIINKSTGKKFGKSEEGAIWLSSDLTSVFKFYQFWLNMDDEGVRSKENIGALFRTADGAGVSEVVLCGISPCPINRFGNVDGKITKSALGAEQSVAWRYEESCAKAVEGRGTAAPPVKPITVASADRRRRSQQLARCPSAGRYGAGPAFWAGACSRSSRTGTDAACKSSPCRSRHPCCTRPRSRCRRWPGA